MMRYTNINNVKRARRALYGVRLGALGLAATLVGAIILIGCAANTGSGSGGSGNTSGITLSVSDTGGTTARISVRSNANGRLHWVIYDATGDATAPSDLSADGIIAAAQQRGGRTRGIVDLSADTTVSLAIQGLAPRRAYHLHAALRHRSATTVGVAPRLNLSTGTIKYTCNRGTAQTGTPDGTTDVERCSACTIGLAPVNNVCNHYVVRQITTGSDHTCARLDTNGVKCWGSGNDGRLGYGDTNNRGDGSGEMGNNLAFVDLGTGRSVQQIVSKGRHTCAILDNDTLKCWGEGGSGRLGYGTTNDRGDGAGEMGNNLPAVALGTGRTAKQVATGANHTCAILDNNRVKCWGVGGVSGKLGHGATTNLSDNADETNDKIPFVDLGTGRTATQIGTGQRHTCALLDNKRVKCWGTGASGRLGYGDSTTRGDDANEMGDNLPFVDLGTGRSVKQIAVGTDHTCALLDNNSVKCWGVGGNGRLGYGDTTTRGDGANEMGNNLPAVSLGTGRTAKQITAGGTHTCALLDNNSVKCWGFGSSGQLGYGDNAARGDSAGEMGNNLPAVALGSGRSATQIAAGGSHTCALLDNHALKCWGSGSNGRLGYGDTNSRGDEVNEMGDNLPVINLGNR